jgi:hypothetical protein
VLSSKWKENEHRGCNVATEPVHRETLPYEDTTSSGLYYEPREPAGRGLLTFAVVMMALAGTWAIIEGIAAIAESKVFVAGSTFIFSDLRTWGWIVTGLGVLLLFSAFAVFSGSQLARWFGILAAGLNGIGQLLFIQAYPLWSMAMFAADIIIIYALVMYAGPKLKRPI